MRSMKSLCVFYFLMLSLIFAFSTILHVTAQTNLEDQLEIAKEKVAQIKSEYTLQMRLWKNFLTSLNRLSNITLSQEQVKEVEAVRDIILYPCTQRIDSEKKNPGSLCDAFADYLVDKCKRFDNLLAFCFGDS